MQSMQRIDPTDPTPRREAELLRMTGYSRWFCSMAKRAGFRHEFAGGKSTVGHWLTWLREHADFKAKDYCPKKYAYKRKEAPAAR